MTPADAAGRLGITVRQIDYWAATGYIDLPPRGSGHTREITGEMFELLGRMAHLTRAGFTVPAAAVLARRVGAHADEATLQLSEQVTVTITKERA